MSNHTSSESRCAALFFALTIVAVRRVVWFSVMSKQMTSPIESIPLHHGDNRGICLREPTALAVVMLVVFVSCCHVVRLLDFASLWLVGMMRKEIQV